MSTDFRIGWRAFGRAVAIALAAAAIAGGVAFALSQALPKGYQAEARVLVGSLTATSTDQLDAYHRLAQTYAELATGDPLLDRVIGRLGLAGGPQQLASRVDARATTQGIVVIDATATTAVEASRIADAVADEVLRLATPSGSSTSIAEVVQPAVTPDSPSSPNVGINTLVAGFLGLALGLGLGLAWVNRRAAAGATAGASSPTWPLAR